MVEIDDLSEQLRALGDALVFDDGDLVDWVLGRVDVAPRARARLWLVAAAVVLMVLAAVALIPDSRHAVARWLGLDGVTVKVDPEVTGTAAPVAFDLPGPGDSRVVDV